ncbi:DgyrCDS9815 [Dimorphilus gyrociliatus]|uniref:DgyrCDS9815 n=1 Tax=Dimorphilus gyrociliatus TaxID=2664684 RepID=A0A7I8VY36_9ANNE|nr:DgyrCDS9815 [Dimorphilus gyrociliatus]
MVSIPSWQRVRGQQQFAKEEHLAPVKTADEFRQEEIIREAEANGYFLIPAKEFISSQFFPEEEQFEPVDKEVLEKQPWKRFEIFRQKRNNELSNIRLVKLIGVRLRGVGDLGILTNLRICSLANNYIEDIKGLQSCTKLIKLDVSSNLIKNIPGFHFWENFTDLRILHLHDNPIGSIEHIKSLGALDSITILTLYDTPLSLKRNYRHHVVNSLWSLKALDHHVISDEEIIEDAKFGGRFAMFSNNFRINLYENASQNASYEDEMKIFCEIINKTNKCLAHYSPVLLLQRIFRGYLTRKHLHMKPNRLFKNVKVMGSQMDTTRMDYDMYLANRRPGSGTVETSRQQSGKRLRSANSIVTDRAESRNRSVGSAVSVKSSIAFKGICVSKSQLEDGGLLLKFSKKNDEVDAYLGEETTVKLPSRGRSKRSVKPPPPTAEEKKRVQRPSVRHFFGPVVNPPNSPEAEDEDDAPENTNFRLRGFKPVRNKLNPTAQLLIDKRNAGLDVRHGMSEAHEAIDKKLFIKPVSKKKQKSGESSQMVKKLFEDSSFSCLRAVHTAYSDRQKAEKLAHQLEVVMSMKEEREAARRRVKAAQEQKRTNALIWRERELKSLQESLQKRQELHRTALMRATAHRSKSTAISRFRQRERTFVSDFAVQNTSVSNALMKHDRSTVKEDQLHSKSEMVSAYRQQTAEQAAIVQRYLEHRQLLLQNDRALSRANIDAKMLQEANSRLGEARDRVQKLKNRQNTISDVLPPVTAPFPTEDERSDISRKKFSSQIKSNRSNTVLPVS